MVVLLLLQALDLQLTHLPNILFHPFMEWHEKPSKQFNTPLTRYLQEHLGPYRVSGLPHPLFTGHLHRFQTLGYAGGCQPLWLWRLRGSGNPQGTGTHDWFDHRADHYDLDYFGVRFAYAPRGRPSDRWLPTPIPHLWENPAARLAPSWQGMERLCTP